MFFVNVLFYSSYQFIDGGQYFVFFQAFKCKVIFNKLGRFQDSWKLRYRKDGYNGLNRVGWRIEDVGVRDIYFGIFEGCRKEEGLYLFYFYFYLELELMREVVGR